MTKKQKLSQAQPKKITDQPLSTLPRNLSNNQPKNLRQRQLTEYLSQPKPQQTKINKRNSQHQPLKPERKQSFNSDKSKSQAVSKLKKKISKKKKSKSKNDDTGKKNGVKLQRGYKFCQNCQVILNIHKYVCTDCGFVHNMKKHKFDVMKNLSKGTPKIVKSIIESNQFNTIKLNPMIQNSLFPSSFTFDAQLEKNGKINQTKFAKKSKQSQMKRFKSENVVQKPEVNEKELQSIHNNNEHLSEKIKHKLDCKSTQFTAKNKIIFHPLSITQIENLQGSKLPQHKSVNKQNKTRQQFSIYQSSYPITLMQSITTFSNDISSITQDMQCLLFTESVTKKQVFNDEHDLLSGFGQSRSDQMQQVDSESSEMSLHANNDKKLNVKGQLKKELMLKKQQQRQRLKKLRQNNVITQKALGLQNFHKIGSIYQGETIINIMSINKNCNSEQNSRIIQPTIEKGTLTVQSQIKRRSSTRSSNPKQSKDSCQFSQKKVQQIAKESHNLNEYKVIRIGLTEHVQMVKSIRNKVAILTGTKSILLMNVNLSWKQPQNDSNQLNANNTTWLKFGDFSSENIHLMNSNKKQPSLYQYFTKISLSSSTIPGPQDDQFSVIQWLKLYSQSKSNSTNKNRNNFSYLATGTLYGHIVVYQISPLNQFSTYRTIIGAHFQLINCIKQCPLNNNGTSIFASASYDGSVKVWELQHKSTICEFQVSNRKIQEIHWDSGAKFLLVVRDQGLENCYLACFYSVSNRVQLPIMLADSIDFRLIRNGILFDNSCSPLIGFPLNSKLVVMVNSKNGFFKILEAQELRKTSLKRKKSKKSCQQQIYHDYWIRLNSSKASKNNEVTKDLKQKLLISPVNQTHQVIRMIANLNSSIYSKLGFSSIPQCDVEQQAHENVQSSQEEVSDSEQSLEQQKKLHNNSNKSKLKIQGKKLINKIQQSPKPTEPIGIRKSLRARKPNVQYNFIEEQEIEDQKPKKKLNQSHSRKQSKKNKSPSDEQQFLDQEQQSSQEEEQESDQSFAKNKNQHNSLNKKSEIKKNSIKNSKHISSVVSKSKNETSLKIQSQHRNSGLSKNNQKLSKVQQLQGGNQGPNAEEFLYKLFWQQTSEQSLVNQKDQYPCNRFPKFSSIASFVTFSEDVQKASVGEVNKKQEKRRNQTKKQNKQGKNQIEQESDEIGSQMIQNKLQMKDENESSQSQQIEISEQDKEEIIDSDQESEREQKLVKQKKGKIQQKESVIEKGGKSQACIQYLTTFIAGYSGELIRVKIRVQGYQRNEQKQGSN